MRNKVGTTGYTFRKYSSTDPASLPASHAVSHSPPQHGTTTQPKTAVAHRHSILDGGSGTEQDSTQHTMTVANRHGLLYGNSGPTPNTGAHRTERQPDPNDHQGHRT
jgi:hypothetical protein